MSRFFITGTAGFIGFHLAQRLLQLGHEVHGYDGMTEYYDVKLKHNRLNKLKEYNLYSHTEAMLENMDALHNAALNFGPEILIHLAAQAGVRYSLENPRAYVNSNLLGSFNVLEIAREFQVRHLMLASTSSVYGANEKIPFEESDMTAEPMTLYAATKKSMEVMAHSYSHLWKIPTTAFRFFTVYGPYGRPDMALYKFVEAALNNKPIDVYGMGNQKRDFTYIDDLVLAIIKLSQVVPDESNRVSADYAHDTLSKQGPFRVVNIGGGQPVDLLSFVDTIENAIGLPIQRNMLPMQQGDVPRTYACPKLLIALTGFVPSIDLEKGVQAFVDWFLADNLKN